MVNSRKFAARLVDPHALLRDRQRQAAAWPGQPVLHVDLRQVGLVPGSKLSVIAAGAVGLGDRLDVDQPGEPFISRSITLSTLSSSVCAEAPG
jgi:hypothetical protein